MKVDIEPSEAILVSLFFSIIFVLSLYIFLPCEKKGVPYNENSNN